MRRELFLRHKVFFVIVFTMLVMFITYRLQKLGVTPARSPGMTQGDRLNALKAAHQRQRHSRAATTGSR